MRHKATKNIDSWIKTAEEKSKAVADILRKNRTRLERSFERKKPSDLQTMVETVMESGIYATLPNMDEIDSAIRLIRDTNPKLGNKLNYSWSKFIAYGAEIRRTNLTESQRLGCFADYDKFYNEVLTCYKEFFMNCAKTGISQPFDII